MLKTFVLKTLTYLFPKARAELLRLLFAPTAPALHLRDLARLSNLAVGTIQREIANMRDAELILERRDGNRLYLYANREHPIFPDLVNIVGKTTGLVPQLRSQLESLGSINLAFIFGSFAGSKESAASDVDLFVVGTIGLRKLAPALRPIADTLGREINPVIFTPEIIREKTENNDAFIKSVTNGPKLWILGTAHEFEAMVR